MATLIKRGDFWYVKFYDHNGKQVMRKGYSDKRETQSLANQIEDEKTKMKRGDIDPKNEQRKVERAKEIPSHLSAYKASMQAKGNSDTHCTQAIADIQAFIDFAQVKHAEPITRGMVDHWVLALKESGGANRTVNRRVGALKSFLKKLHSIHTITEYVLYKYPKLPEKGHERRLPRPLEISEQEKLLAKSPAERVDIYRFCLGTGARHGACSSLEVQHINFADKTISLKRKRRIKGSSERYIIPIHSALIPILTLLCVGKDRTARVFNVPVRSMASRLLRKDCEDAGVRTDKVMFHGLRHTFITTLAKANIHPNVVQALADHRDITTTLDYYTHFKRSDERSSLEFLKL